MVRVSSLVLLLGSVALVPLTISQSANAKSPDIEESYGSKIAAPFKGYAKDFVARKSDDGLKIVANKVAASVKRLAGDLIYAHPDLVDAEGRPIYYRNARTVRNIFHKMGIELDSLAPGAGFILNKIENKIASAVLGDLETNVQKLLYGATIRGLQLATGAEEATTSSIVSAYAASIFDNLNEGDLPEPAKKASSVEKQAEFTAEDETTFANALQAQFKIALYDWILTKSTELVQSTASQVLDYSEEKTIESATTAAMYGVYAVGAVSGAITAPGSIVLGAAGGASGVKLLHDELHANVANALRYGTGSKEILEKAKQSAKLKATQIAPLALDRTLNQLGLGSFKPTSFERETIEGKIDSTVHSVNTKLGQDWKMSDIDNDDVVEITRSAGYFDGVKNAFSSVVKAQEVAKQAVSAVGRNIAALTAGTKVGNAAYVVSGAQVFKNPTEADKKLGNAINTAKSAPAKVIGFFSSIWSKGKQAVKTFNDAAEKFNVAMNPMMDDDFWNDKNPQ